MLSTILVPLDGSELSEHALPYAEVLAWAGDARLVLTHAALPPVAPRYLLQDLRGAVGELEHAARSAASTLLPTTAPGFEAQAEAEVVTRADAYLTRLACGLSRSGITTETVLAFREPIGAILEAIRTREPDLVVMATHGRSGLGRWAYGSVAEAVLRCSPVPVLLVQAWQVEGVYHRLAARPPLLVPLDGSSFAEEALRVAAELAYALGGQLILMQAVPAASASPIRPEHGSYCETAMSEARNYLSRVADRITREELLPMPQIDVRVGDPAESIAAAADAHEAGLVVMASHGRTGIMRRLFGGVGYATLRRARVPLLVVRLQGAQALPAEVGTLRDEQLQLAGAGAMS
jgi:nucleotide-binding universal stress UspA family protein